MSHHGLVGLKIEDGDGSFYAPLQNGSTSRPYKFIKFPDWWNKIVIVDSKKSKFNRRELVLALANKDGGAHVDPDLDQAYSDLTRNNSVGWMFSDGKEVRPMGSVELFSVRQIAFETIESIERIMKKHEVA